MSLFIKDDDEFAPENVTFAPKDVTPVDFTPKDDVHGLGYRGLDPLQALTGGPGASHVNLFTLDSDRTSLFGGRKAGQRRKGGISGQVRFVFFWERRLNLLIKLKLRKYYFSVCAGVRRGSDGGGGR